jgi:hypothetical protein
MIHEIINTGEYLLIVDPKAIVEEGEVCLFRAETDYIVKATNPIEEDLVIQDIYWKIVAHLPLKDSEVLKGVPLLPPLDVNVQTMPVGFDIYATWYGMYIPATGQNIPVSDDWVGNYVYDGLLDDKCLWTKDKIKKEGESCALNNNCVFPKCLTMNKNQPITVL